MGSSCRCPRKEFERSEQEWLHKGAARSNDARLIHRIHDYKPDDFRTEFHRDYTRIVHSRAFRRLRHKTQVFIDPWNDHICTRLEHSLLVASIAKTIARALKLNEDLVSAIAVGHDLGHAPFGHKGEEVLKKLAEGKSLSFFHETHSLRVVDFVERSYPEHHGLNLTVAVRDGIACHCGERPEQTLKPDRKRTADDLPRVKPREAIPATLEGCVVRFSDIIAYLGRDFEDAVELKYIRKDKLPAEIRKALGESNREIISAIVKDLCRNSVPDEDTIGLSEPIFDVVCKFREFNLQKIYRNRKATGPFKRVERAIHEMFDFLIKRAEQARSKGNADAARWNGTKGSKDDWCSQTFVDFLKHDIGDWENQEPPQIAIDFIAGMTDSFFNVAFQEAFLPESTA